MASDDVNRGSDSFTRISRSLIERSMELRCQAYLAGAKHRLLLQTIMELDRSRRGIVKTNENLQEMDKIKTIFIAGLTHELNNPLSAIIGYTELIMMGAAGPLTEKQQNYLRNVFLSAEHLRAIVADALDIAKIEADALEANYEPFFLQQAVDEVLNQFTQRADEKGLTLMASHAEGVSLFSDRRRLVQCLINLISNAIKYTERGGITITTRLCKQGVAIDVADSGIGLSEEDQQHLFEIFHRGVLAKKSKEAGSGIGLFLTHKLVTTILHGDIQLVSEINKGSTFTLTLPLSVNAENPYNSQ